MLYYDWVKHRLYLIASRRYFTSSQNVPVAPVSLPVRLDHKNPVLWQFSRRNNRRCRSFYIHQLFLSLLSRSSGHPLRYNIIQLPGSMRLTPLYPLTYSLLAVSTLPTSMRRSSLTVPEMCRKHQRPACLFRGRCICKGVDTV